MAKTKRPLVGPDPLPRTPAQVAAKRLMDIAGSLFLIVALGPAILFVAVAILATSGRPVVFAQGRIGLGGKPFRLYKFRTMVPGAEEELGALAHRNEVAGPVFKMRRDPRLTKLGMWLRFFSLDELPQFFNVLAGDVSLVGPRPALPAEVARYEPWQRRRLSVVPGITCTWQVEGRNEIPFERWVEMDLAYIDSWSLRQDFEILLRTIPAVLLARGAW